MILSAKTAKMLMLSSLLCNDTLISKGKITGDPTEVALTEFATGFGFEKEKLFEKCPRLGEAPFTSERKLMSVMCNVEGEKLIFTKGAFDRLLKKCDKICDKCFIKIKRIKLWKMFISLLITYFRAILVWKT